MSERPFPRHQASTRFLRVPSVDWSEVNQGLKTEFRTSPRDGVLLTQCELPTPVVAYCTQTGAFRGVKSTLMVLEARRREPLFAISDDFEALEREGFPTYDHFRRYWRARHGGRYVPQQRVWVWRVRAFRDQDIIVEGARLLRALYGEHLPDARERLRHSR